MALLSVVYICGVTALSRGEVHGGKRATVLFSFICMLSVLAGALVMTLNQEYGSLVCGVLLILVLGWRILPPLASAYNNPQPSLIRNMVKTGVLSLVFLDAIIASAFAGAVYALVVLTAAILAGRLARLFAVT